jgi:hypothetical protein
MCGLIESNSLIANRSFLPPRPPALQPIRPSRPFLGVALHGPSAAPDLRHPFLVAIDAPQQAGHVKINIEIRPMETCSAPKNLYPRNLLSSSRSQPLQFFAWNYMPAAIGQLEDQQVQTRTGPIFHLRHERLISQLLAPFDGAVDCGIARDDRMSDGLVSDSLASTLPISHVLTPCHAWPPTTPPVPQNAGPQRSRFSLRPTAPHSRAGRSRPGPLRQQLHPTEDR